MFGIRLHQKPENKFLYFPAKSSHEKHTISNYMSGELKRYVRSNSKEINFLAIKVMFFGRLHLIDTGLVKTWDHHFWESMYTESPVINLQRTTLFFPDQAEDDKEEENNLFIPSRMVSPCKTQAP